MGLLKKKEEPKREAQFNIEPEDDTPIKSNTIDTGKARNVVIRDATEEYQLLEVRIKNLEEAIKILGNGLQEVVDYLNNDKVGVQ